MIKMFKDMFKMIFVKNEKFLFERFILTVIILILGAALLFTANFGYDKTRGFYYDNKPIDTKVNIGKGQQ